MNRKAAITVAIGALAGLSSVAISQEARRSSASRGTIALSSVPATDEELRRLGVRSLKAADIDRMKATLVLLSSRSGGGGHGLNYTCTSESNACVCHGWLDCVNAMDECKTPPKNPDGTLCTGEAACTCTWH